MPTAAEMGTGRLYCPTQLAGCIVISKVLSGRNVSLLSQSKGEQRRIVHE